MSRPYQGMRTRGKKRRVDTIDDVVNEVATGAKRAPNETSGTPVVGNAAISGFQQQLGSKQMFDEIIRRLASLESDRASVSDTLSRQTDVSVQSNLVPSTSVPVDSSSNGSIGTTVYVLRPDVQKPIFKGHNDTNPMRFLKQLKKYIKAINASDRAVEIALECVSGPAQQVLELHSEQWNTLDDLEKEFTKVFWGQTQQEAAKVHYTGGMMTATAARAARRRPQRVNYAADLERSESDRIPRLVIGKVSDDSGTATPTGFNGDRSSPFPSLYNSNYRNGDIKSLSNYRIYSPTNATPRKRSEVTMDAQSIRSVETPAPPHTDPVKNKKQTKIYITKVTSSMYAILLVTLGLIFHIGDAFTDVPISAIYSIFLATIGFLYILYLIIDITRYKSIALKNQKEKTEHEEKLAEYLQEDEYCLGSPGDRTPNELYRPPTNLPPPRLIPLDHDYCFNYGRHSGSFYLKLGAAGFALGNLVHSVLLIAVQMGYLFDDDIDNESCIDYTQMAMDIFNPFFCFLQLFFIFKYSNVIIVKRQALAKVAFMHMIGSSLCFWISAIVRETLLALTLYAQSIYGKESNYTLSDGLDHQTKDSDMAYFINITNLYDENCIGSTAVNRIVESFSPYLYPFSVEFNILIVAVYYIIWSNVGNCNNEDNSNSDIQNSVDDSYSICKIPTANEDNDFTSNIVIHADCHASNKGLFLGLIVMVIITGMLILGFVFSSVGGEFFEVGYLLNDCTRLGLHTILLFGVIVAFTQTTKLDINEHPISLLDDILLFICLPPFFMETVFSLVATLTIINIVKSVDFILMVIQVLIQTPLIMDALRRCSNTRNLRRTKPGRELIMFLIITNVGMWLFYTFSYKSPDSLDERYTFYGKVLWSILGHVSLPLIMFYRFHSSVCFADIWGSAYKPGSEH